MTLGINAWPDNAAAIARLIPHQGRMCLLDAVLDCSPTHIRCRAISHRDPANPLRSARDPVGLLAPVAIEYAAQAMALHGALNARPGVRGRPGFLASARAVRLPCTRLDAIEGALIVEAWPLAGDGRQALYRFALSDERGRCCAEGRAAVVLDTPLTAD